MFPFAIPNHMPTAERAHVPNIVRGKFGIRGSVVLLGAHAGYRLYAIKVED